MKSSLLKRIITASNVIKKNNLELDIKLNIINEIDSLDLLKSNAYHLKSCGKYCTSFIKKWLVLSNIFRVLLI